MKTAETIKKCSKRFAATSQELPLVLAWIKEESEKFLPLSLAMRLQLAAEEAAVNIINYAYNGLAGEKYLQLDFVEVDNAVTLCLEDAGVAFNMLHADAQPDPRAALDERRAGGWGLVMLHKFTDAATYERRDDKNILLLTINKN